MLSACEHTVFFMLDMQIKIIEDAEINAANDQALRHHMIQRKRAQFFQTLYEQVVQATLVESAVI